MDEAAWTRWPFRQDQTELSYLLPREPTAHLKAFVTSGTCRALRLGTESLHSENHGALIGICAPPLRRHSC